MFSLLLSYLTGAGKTLLNFGSSAKSKAQKQLNTLLQKLGYNYPISKEGKLKLLEKAEKEIKKEIKKTKEGTDAPNLEVVMTRDSPSVRIFRINNTTEINFMYGNNGLFSHIYPLVQEMVRTSPRFPFKLNIFVNINYRRVYSDHSEIFPYSLNHKAVPIIKRRDFNRAKFDDISKKLLYDFENPEGVPSGVALAKIRFCEVWMGFYKPKRNSSPSSSSSDENELPPDGFL